MTAPKVPSSVLRASRAEVTDVTFDVVLGTIPEALQGHLFFVGPVGTVASGGLPYPNPTSVLNGDGMVVRVDFAKGNATFSTRIVETWDQRADVLTHDTHALELLRFVPAGIARIGLLGARDFVNTAFQPIAEASGVRLLVTCDAGRPWEIDTSSLRAVTPLGKRSEWVPSALGFLPFPLVLTPAHPAYDPKTSEFVTVNYVRSFASILGIGAVTTNALSLLPKALQDEVHLLLSGTSDVASARSAAHDAKSGPLGLAILDHVESLFESARASSNTDSCRALVWTGEGEMTATPLLMPGGEPVVIKQTVHQVALTESHLVLLDTGFKFGIAQLFNNPAPEDPRLDAFIRELLDKPQMDQTILYVVRRDALGKGVPATAQQVVIPIEADHFLADYDDRDGTITVHVAHAPATDLAEWWRAYDKQFYTKEQGSYAAGFLSIGAMDVGRLGRYKIDAATGTVTDARVLSDDEKLWAISLYAGRDLCSTDPLPERIESLFWGTEGFIPDLLTDWVFDHYKGYAHRETPLSEIRGMGSTGRPSCLVRLDTRTMTLADARVLPPGYLTSSLQFVKRPGGTGDAGWLLCTIFTDVRVELWILDAEDLNAAPTILASPALPVGFTLHTAWLPGPLSARRTRYAVSPDDDLAPLQASADAPDPAVHDFIRDTLLPDLRKRFVSEP